MAAHLDAPGAFHTKGAKPSSGSSNGLVWLLAGAITVYQRTLSRLLGPRCRFYPSCSQHAKECLLKYPLPLASGKIARRLLSCHPLHPGGIDLP